MRRDDKGFFYFVGRDDDTFNCGGENIYPGEVERVLEGDPRIAECCVVPVSDAIKGQKPVAFVVIAEGQEAGAGMNSIHPVPYLNWIDMNRKEIR